MMSAKDYFYKYHSKTEYGATYSDYYHHLSEEEKARIHHTPLRSNDFLIESYMNELISVAPPEFRGRIEQCFVGKIRNFDANAAAWHSEDEHYGDLIIFNVGLSDACFQYAILFQEFISFRRMNGLGKNRVEAELTLGKRIAKLARSQRRWNNVGEVALMHEDNLLPLSKDEAGTSSSMATMADKFVLYHEICHHLLGHTSMWGSALLDSLPDKCKCWNREINSAHKREFQADAGAIMLALWSSVKDARAAEITAILGALLFFTTVGQFSKDAWAPTDSHPAEGERFVQCCNVLAELISAGSDFSNIFKDMMKFQTVLFRTQGNGIGARWGKQRDA